MDSVIEQTRELEVDMMAVATLKPYARNPRQHSAQQIRQIADSVREFGFTNPLLIDADGGVIAGHGRLEAAKLLGLVHVPTIRLDHMTDAQKRAYIIADNKLAENAGWDRELLALELKELSLNFDITLTGFEMPEIDLLLGELGGSGSDAADEIPEVDTKLLPVNAVEGLAR
ncbi:MAG TPA: ParB/Srx family N-terminal domain-containing protein [Roseiarcus sp.]|nr:ParB/Srx family N-terminal domain-containing protein [Roseiarcus sp.]